MEPKNLSLQKQLDEQKMFIKQLKEKISILEEQVFKQSCLMTEQNLVIKGLNNRVSFLEL